MLNQVFNGLVFPPTIRSFKGSQAAVAQFRLWPVDCDIFGHMNNASYIRVAELHRWRMAAESRFLSYSVKHKIAFLAVDQTVNYKRPILPFQKYNVTTTVTVSEDDKYVNYHHSFDQPNGQIGEEADAKRHYALVTIKAVMKHPSGKTLRPSEMININPYFKNLITK